MKHPLHYLYCFMLVILMSCGGGKNNQETSENSDQPESNTQAPQDLNALLEGKWELVESYDGSGVKMENSSGSISFTQTDFEIVGFPINTYADEQWSPTQPTTGSWSFVPELKNEEQAINCIMFKGSDGNEYGWNLMSVSQDELVMVFTTVPEKRIFNRSN